MAPVQDSAAFVVALICGGIGLVGILLIKDERERLTLMVLFGLAYVLRLCFTFFCYKTDLIAVLGGNGDESTWVKYWTHSLYWRALPHDPSLLPYASAAGVPVTIADIYDAAKERNKGFEYFATYFYYLLSFRSQMALSFVNCFLNALAVLLVYKISREFFTEKAARFAAGVAVILPSYLVWSALSIKETWLILFEIAILFSVYRCSRQKNWLWGLLAFSLIILAQGFRFYLGWILWGATALAFICFRSQRPFKAAVSSLAAMAALFLLLQAFRVVRFDVAKFSRSQLQEMSEIRGSLSMEGRRGNNSSVQLDYDIETPGGMAMMALTGSTYLLLSPFPWDLFKAVSLRQLMTLPDIVLWYVLVFVFIIPGSFYARRRQPQLLVSLLAFTLPLILLYSLIFANVGLAYRQRAQLMPFFLILAAAGYERRERAKAGVTLRKQVQVPLRHDLIQKLQRTPVVPSRS